MSHITSIGAGLYSDMSVYTATTVTEATYSAFNSKAAFDALFASAADFARVTNVREFPAIGTPPNIVNVPAFGQATTSQIQGQADAPNMEIQMNFVPSLWADGTTLGDLVGGGKVLAFRFALLNSQPSVWTSAAGGIGAVANSYWYFLGKMEALMVNPQLTDANTATLTVSVQSSFFGAYTT